MIDDRNHEDADNLVEVPTPHPPEGGPNADPNSPDPADLVPGLGGTSKTKPAATEDDG